MLKKILLLPLVIFIVGTAIWFFLISLNVLILFFQTHWEFLLFGLPILALSSAYLDAFKKFPWCQTTETLLTEVRNPKKHVHWCLAPWIYLLTLLFHLFGASVGRESTAVQMGGSLSETLGRMLRIPVEDRPILIRMGLSAGFGAAFGVPWAGSVFGLESPLLFRKRDWFHFPFYLLSSWGAHQWAAFLGLNHLVWKDLAVDFWDLNWQSYSQLGFCLIVFTLAYELIFLFTQSRIKRWPWWLSSGIPAVLLVIFTFWIGSPIFNNLGTDLIEASFNQASSFSQAFGKLIFTFISTVSGMKGGEVTPLMSAGALFGSWIAASQAAMNFQIGAALGLVTLFTSRLKIPITGIFMLVEFFDWKIAALGGPILIVIALIRPRMIKFYFRSISD